jgi:hypothetical protein
MTRSTLMRLLGLVCLVALLGGCGEAGPTLYPAGGTVTYKGEALDGATVTFSCDEANTVATGKTDAQGRFELSTYKRGEGAAAGKHTVTVSKVKVSAPSGPPTMEMSKDQKVMDDIMGGGFPPELVPPESEIPEKYNDAARPILEFTVSAEASNDFKIELTD